MRHGWLDQAKHAWEESFVVVGVVVAAAVVLERGAVDAAHAHTLCPHTTTTRAREWCAAAAVILQKALIATAAAAAAVPVQKALLLAIAAADLSAVRFAQMAVMHIATLPQLLPSSVRTCWAAPREESSLRLFQASSVLMTAFLSASSASYNSGKRDKDQ